jgi:CubicO group peptidase (beta-lactamase class C family)
MTAGHPEPFGRLRSLEGRLREGSAVANVVARWALLTIVALAPCLGQAKSATKPDLAAFDQYVAKAVRDWHVTGLAIAIVSGDSLVFAKGYGVLDLRKPSPVNEHTRFAVGSTTKAMTSAALGMLVDEGKIHWDDRVIDILPDFRLYDAYATRETTIRDLLTHRTGLPGTDLFWAREPFTLQEMIHRLRYVKPATSFRSTMEYQNVVYAIGGAVVEKVSGIPWDAFIRQRIFAPLGMTESEPLVANIVGKPNVATPHAPSGDTAVVVPIRSTDGVAPAGSVWSSVSDMSKWMRFILDSGRVGPKRLITPATFTELVTPQIRAPMALYPALSLARPHAFSYGLGWFVHDYQGETVWMHTGSIDGMSAIIGLLPDRRTGVYVLANLDHAELRHALMYKVFDLYSGSRDRDWSAEVHTLFARPPVVVASGVAVQPTPPPASLALERYAGTYVDSAYGVVDVRFGGGSLSARFRDKDVGALDHVRSDTFRTHDAGADALSFSFVTDGTGNVLAVRMLGVTFDRVRTR